MFGVKPPRPSLPAQKRLVFRHLRGAGLRSTSGIVVTT